MLPASVMFQKINDFASAHPDILAAYLNGSRTNPSAPRDLYQDYDLVYVTADIQRYIHDKSWISYFGEIAVMQEPDCSELFPSERDPSLAYAFLMQFQNGDRIDLTFQHPDLAKTACLEDRLTVLLFDKAGVLPPIPSATDETHWIKRPTQQHFTARCNEFWWVAPYVAKGLARNELLYASDMLTQVRGELLTMLSYLAASEHGFTISTGKSFKYLPGYLSDSWMQPLAETFAPLEQEALWNALFSTCHLMSRAARAVSQALGFTYNVQEEKGSLQHMENVRYGRYHLEETP